MDSISFNDMDNATADVILALQFQDLADLGRAHADGTDVPSDQDAAIELYRIELNQSAAILQDHQIGEALGEAAAGAEATAMTIQSVTPCFDRLKEHILRPSEPDDIHEDCDNCSPSPPPLRLQLNRDSQENLTGDEASELSIDCNDSEGNHIDMPESKMQERMDNLQSCEDEGVNITSNTPLSTRTVEQVSRDESAKPGSCIICEFQLPLEELFIGSCQDQYCRECINELFRTALKDESLFPPRCCCNELIPLRDVRFFLDKDIIRTFPEKEIEYSTTDRVYCSNLECSRFVHPAYINDNIAKCRGCLAETCKLCKAAAHCGKCRPDPATTSFMATARQLEFQQCSQCHMMVELTYGCNHIVCRCGAQFCYECGLPWKSCRCELIREDRLLLHPAVQILDGNNAVGRANYAFGPRMNPPIARGCLHGAYWTRIDGGDLLCQECGQEQRTFILECPGCHLRACLRCKTDLCDDD